MADYGIKVTQAGKSITSIEPRDYVFNSTYSAVKLARDPIVGTATVSAGPFPLGSAVVTQAHGLSFVPLVLFYSELKSGSGKYFIGAAAPTDGSSDDPDASFLLVADGVDADQNPVNCYADATNVVLTYRNGDSVSHTVKYIILVFGDSAT